MNKKITELPVDDKLVDGDTVVPICQVSKGFYKAFSLNKMIDIIEKEVEKRGILSMKIIDEETFKGIRFYK